jgi:hypothetical protein
LEKEILGKREYKYVTFSQAIAGDEGHSTADKSSNIYF